MDRSRPEAAAPANRPVRAEMRRSSHSEGLKNRVMGCNRSDAHPIYPRQSEPENTPAAEILGASLS